MNQSIIFIKRVCMLLLIVELAACKKYLDVKPTTSLSTTVAFSNLGNATETVLGVYARLAGDAGYGLRLSMYFTVDQDEMLGPANSSAPDNDRRDVARYGATPNNAVIQSPFDNLYIGINRANVCIKNIPLMNSFSQGSLQEQTALKRLLGESLTLRAQFFFELIRNWGDVPASFIPSEDQAVLALPKTDRDAIYERLLNDLLIAEDLVPWRTEVGGRNERITKGAVKALRARLALFRGGYSLRSNGVMERRVDYVTYYKIAHQECAELIMRSDQHALNSSYESLFKNYIDGHTADPTYEVLFEVAMGGGAAANDSKLGHYDGPRSITSALDAPVTVSIGSSAVSVLATYFYSFNPEDTRRDVTAASYWTNADGIKVLQKLTGLVNGKYRRDWVKNPSIDPSSVGQYFGINWPIIRFSDVLLMYAEADNELNKGPSVSALAAYNEVRQRGFAGNPSSTASTPTAYAEFFNSIVSERSFEFGGEGIRKYDLIRWNLLESKINETRSALDAMIARRPPYDNLPQALYYKPGQQTVELSASLYDPAPSTTPKGTTKVAWISTLTPAYVANVAQVFRSGHGELLPFALAALQSNPFLDQNPGY